LEAKLIFWLLIASITAFGQTESFLSKSKILSEAGVKIIPAQIKSHEEVLPVFSSESTERKFMVEESGLEELEKIKSGKKSKLKISTCGSDELASPWKMKGRKHPGGIFIASGKQVGEINIKWIKGKELKLENKPECVFYKKDYQLTSFNIVEVAGFRGGLFFSESQSPERIKADIEYKKRKDDDAPIPSMDCSKTDFAFQKIGIIDGSKCKILLESPINCEGQGFEQGSISKPLGMIVISKGKVVEKWMVFLAYGYEGDAFLGVNVGDEGNADTKPIVDFYVYSGC
jgi:hypothetical protein